MRIVYSFMLYMRNTQKIEYPMYDNPEEYYLLLQSLDEKKAIPILVLEDDFTSGIMFEICNRFI